MTRVVLLILAALGLGAFAGVGTFYVQESNTEQALAKYEKVLVLFAIQDVPEGTTLFDALTRRLVEYQLFPEALLPERSLLENGDVDNLSAATHPLVSGTIVLEGDFKVPSQNDATSLVQPQFAAVSLALNLQQRGGGLVTVGSHVGVISTIVDAVTDQKVSRVLFGRVKVLAIDGVTQETGLLSGGQANKEAVVTLTTPSTAVSDLLDAYANGDITLVLLAPGQSLPVTQKGQ